MCTNCVTDKVGVFEFGVGPWCPGLQVLADDVVLVPVVCVLSQQLYTHHTHTHRTHTSHTHHTHTVPPTKGDNKVQTELSHCSISVLL